MKHGKPSAHSFISLSLLVVFLSLRLQRKCRDGIVGPMALKLVAEGDINRIDFGRYRGNENEH